MTTHVNGTAYWPLMNSMVVGRYKSANVTNMKGGYQKPCVVTTLILIIYMVIMLGQTR
jgi:hypothetical protein